MPRRLLAYNTPDSLSGLIAWLKADSLSNSDGDLIAAWTDSSGNSNTPVQATGGLKPTYKVNQINGKPIIRFSGSNRLAFPTESAFDFANLSIFVVFKRTGGTSGDVLSKNTTGFSDSHRRKMQIATSGNNLFYSSGSDGQSIAVTGVPGQFNMFGVVTNGNALHSLFLNGNQTDFTTILGDSTTNTATAEIGAAFSNGAEAFTGDIAEIIIYNRALNGKDVIGLQNYLIAKYNLTANPALGGVARTAINGSRNLLPPIPVLRLNGSSDYVDIGTLSGFLTSLNNDGLCSFCFSMATRSTSLSTVFGSSNGSVNSTLSISINRNSAGSSAANKIGIFIRNNSNVFQNVGTTNTISLADGKMHRYVVKRVSRYVWEIWQDGIFLPMSNPSASGDMTAGFTDFSHSMGIGASISSSVTGFSQIDIANVLIYERALTPTEIANDLLGIYATSPFRYFSLTAGSNIVAIDQSANKINGIIHGSRQIAPRQLVGGGATV